MRTVGIESLNAYGGIAYVDTVDLMTARGLSADRARNLLMQQRSAALPCEDAVSYATNAAFPLVRSMPDRERESIELLVVGTESGVDAAKSVGTWVHDMLGLPRHCRVFETKQACYGGTAALQCAASAVATSAQPGARALAIAVDTPVPAVGSYHEPSQGTGAVAVLVSDRPEVVALEPRATGYHSFHAMDAYRPRVEREYVDADLSLLCYLECLQGAFDDLVRKSPETDFLDSFDQLVMHTPFPGMVKGAHRMLMRRLGYAPDVDVNADYARRVEPSTRYAAQIGNPYTASVLFALASSITHGSPRPGDHIGVFSYGSGCTSEFFQCTIGPEAGELIAAAGIDKALARRTRIDLPDYDELCVRRSPTGADTLKVDMAELADFLSPVDTPFLALTGITEHHRNYTWLNGDA